MTSASGEGNLALGSLRVLSTRATKEEQMKKLVIIVTALAAVVLSGCNKNSDQEARKGDEILKEDPVKKNAEQAKKVNEAVNKLTK